jgi:CBS-domain-containing membrane protein
MAKPQHITEPSPRTVQREAAASDVRHFGPTADRYHGALVRYLDAVTGCGARPRPGAGKLKHPITLVGDVMTREVVAVPEDATFKEIVAGLAGNRISAVPVVDDQLRVCGVVSESDLITRVLMAPGPGPVPRDHEQRTAIRKKAHAFTAQQLMSSPAVTTRAHATIVEAARVAARAHVRHLPVIDSKGVLIEIVSRADLLEVFMRPDDEIRDEIERYMLHAMHLDPSSLSVDVSEGVVTLTGKVERQLQVVELVNHIRGVSGIVDIVDQLHAHFDDRYLPAPRDAR